MYHNCMGEGNNIRGNMVTTLSYVITLPYVFEDIRVHYLAVYVRSLSCIHGIYIAQDYTLFDSKLISSTITK